MYSPADFDFLIGQSNLLYLDLPAAIVSTPTTDVLLFTKQLVLDSRDKQVVYFPNIPEMDYITPYVDLHQHLDLRKKPYTHLVLSFDSHCITIY